MPLDALFKKIIQDTLLLNKQNEKILKATRYYGPNGIRSP